MRGHNICFLREIIKNIFELFLIRPLIWRFVQSIDSDLTINLRILEQTKGSRPRGYKTFSMLNSVEHEIFSALKC